ncbi:MAG: hypothetical protein HOP08_00235 [Cyclobacteriaceae bacterium]|nr:hypothetical protein [Cyclobacteriaceae bacterium]
MRILISLLFILVSIPTFSQSQSSFTETITKLYKAGKITDAASQKTSIDLAWKEIKSVGIPFIKDDSVAFLYHGDAKTVAWMGDFNGWGYRRDFDNRGKRIHGTNIWILRCSFPKDARLDYKIMIDGHRWLLDPENPYQQWSGVGGGSPNSELRMPLSKSDPILKERPGIARGTLKKDLLVSSKILGYQVMYSVYLPAGYEQAGKLPVIYVTDGYEYMMPELGNMIPVLDNLIVDKKIKPIIAVFVDHREPVNRSNNRRMEELNLNEKYLKFFVDELIPDVENNFPVKAEAKDRAIMGTSMGGLTSAYFAFTRTDIFSMAGIQSPAFGTRPQIYTICSSATNPKIRISMTSGLINDASEGSRKMKQILQDNACVYNYRENNEGHSWGNWKNLIDDILIDLFPNQ